MATKHDEFKVYYFSFDEDELYRIVKALIDAGEDDLAVEISNEADLWPDDIDGCEVDSLKFEIDYSAATDAREELDKLAQSARDVQVAAKDLAAAFGCENISMDRVNAMLKEVFGEVRR